MKSRSKSAIFHQITPTSVPTQSERLFAYEREFYREEAIFSRRNAEERRFFADRGDFPSPPAQPPLGASVPSAFLSTSSSYRIFFIFVIFVIFISNKIGLKSAKTRLRGSLVSSVQYQITCFRGLENNREGVAGGFLIDSWMVVERGRKRAKGGNMAAKMSFFRGIPLPLFTYQRKVQKWLNSVSSVKTCISGVFHSCTLPDFR
mmetsp:Transcript_14958/g.60982  ORF Transcript_14958/g.60982 Transcript_14958/m.60982 type:complete len:204 (-) Transcript_14958:2774-3385(-)